MKFSKKQKIRQDLVKYMKNRKNQNDTKFKNDGWCFAIVNGRLAEIHFKKDFGIWAHAYVDRKEFSTKREQKMIDTDTKKCVFSYQKSFYIAR